MRKASIVLAFAMILCVSEVRHQKEGWVGETVSEWHI
jgi:hypothetical protein